MAGLAWHWWRQMMPFCPFGILTKISNMFSYIFIRRILCETSRLFMVAFLISWYYYLVLHTGMRTVHSKGQNWIGWKSRLPFSNLWFKRNKSMYSKQLRHMGVWECSLLLLTCNTNLIIGVLFKPIVLYG